jgi:CheY-like chemotaxis protein
MCSQPSSHRWRLATGCGIGAESVPVARGLLQRIVSEDSACTASSQSDKFNTSMKTVLVVEDTEDLRDLFIEVIRHAGYRVLGAENGAEALEILGSEVTDPCLVLLDMMMPVMDGPMFLNALQQSHRVASLPIVALSAAVTDKDVQGARRFVRKPVSPDVLIALVREYCGSP